MIDKKAIEFHIKGILKALGDAPEREGLKDTPKRVANMYEEIFEGMNYTNHEIAEMVGRRLQLQERIGSDIADIMSEITGSKDVAVTIEASHSCLTSRGIRKPGTKWKEVAWKRLSEHDMYPEMVDNR